MIAMEKRYYFDKPKQVVFADPENPGDWLCGIAYRDENGKAVVTQEREYIDLTKLPVLDFSLVAVCRTCTIEIESKLRCISRAIMDNFVAY